jgi:hypothetical protein
VAAAAAAATSDWQTKQHACFNTAMWLCIAATMIQIINNPVLYVLSHSYFCVSHLRHHLTHVCFFPLTLPGCQLLQLPLSSSRHGPSKVHRARHGSHGQHADEQYAHVQAGPLQSVAQLCVLPEPAVCGSVCVRAVPIHAGLSYALQRWVRQLAPNGARDAFLVHHGAVWSSSLTRQRLQGTATRTCSAT